MNSRSNLLQILNFVCTIHNSPFTLRHKHEFKAFKKTKCIDFKELITYVRLITFVLLMIIYSFCCFFLCVNNTIKKVSFLL